MGSNTSKAISTTTSSSSRNFRKRSRFKGFRGFHSYCLGTSSGSQESDNEDQVCDQNKVDGSDGNLSDLDEVKSKSRLGIISGNISLGFRRFTSSRSSRLCPVSSPSLSIFDNDDDDDASGSGLPCCNMQRNSSVGIGARDELDVNLFSSRIQAETDTIETRHIDRRNRVREPVEHKVRFSRTLSVGRLRDRVLRRSTFSDLTSFPLQQERELSDDSQNTRRQAVERDSRVSPLDLSAISSSTSSVSNSMFSNQNYEVEISQLREGRSNFLERGRRIRSQARSLQRLSSRFENQSAHGRSCILSGQHRTGRCICRFRNRDTNSNDDTGARIVVLAEALFEVLDEIHQQSAVLSSHPSASSLGCVPAPINVVESLPVKLYKKLHKHQEDTTQCYICLVEYEDGDSVRVLPCHHEFHKTCIDKWLKEIHRVCPLCRGNICVSDSEL